MIIPGTDVTPAVITEGGTGVSKTITEYLQKVPTPKATPNANFSVVISATGDVSVNVGNNQLYPTEKALTEATKVD